MGLDEVNNILFPLLEACNMKSAMGPACQARAWPSFLLKYRQATFPKTASPRRYRVLRRSGESEDSKDFHPLLRDPESPKLSIESYRSKCHGFYLPEANFHKQSTMQRPLIQIAFSVWAWCVLYLPNVFSCSLSQRFSRCCLSELRMSLHLSMIQNEQ